jgi:hypothetical protein
MTGKRAQRHKGFSFIMIYGGFIKGNLPRIMDKGRIILAALPVSIQQRGFLTTGSRVS